jgi:hypothetical protein
MGADGRTDAARADRPIGAGRIAGSQRLRLGADDARELADVLNDPGREENVLHWGVLAPRLFGRFEERALQALRAGE